jgi:cobalt-precorrin 5A hydrolase/precorrin-3B C17-methyltransferase
MATGDNVSVFYVTERGGLLARRLMGLYPGLAKAKFTKKVVQDAWIEGGALVFIMAAAIVVRTLAPLIKDKRSDPAVIVLDELGRHVISLLGGHLGGANRKAREIARFLRTEAVVTTGSDVNGLTPIDLWARDNGLVIDDPGALPHAGVQLINGGRLNVYSDIEISLPPDFVRVSDPESAQVFITCRKDIVPKGGLYLRPKKLVVGIGFNRGTSAEEIDDAVKKALDRNKLSFLSVFAVATIDIKKDEQGIAVFAKKSGLHILSFTARELNGVPGVTPSEAAFQATGAKAVAEPAAALGAGSETILVRKEKRGNVTVAVAVSEWPANGEKAGRQEGHERGRGRICVVGIGPGNAEFITPHARKAILDADVVVGYHAYMDLIRDLVTDKKTFATGMTQEVARCRKAVEIACEGQAVAMVCGGDPGIYAMAGLVFEVLREKDGPHELPAVEIIPGVSAMNACAARLGAPLMHDFASVSLSDRLTPWNLIEKRLDAAAMAGFVIVLYNPKSRGRAGHIEKAREIVLRHRAPETPVGIVRGAMRTDEGVVVTDLKSMADHDIDMHTTVIIGNSQTFRWGEWMITPRGYEGKLKS